MAQDVLLTNSTGAYGPAIAEHMLAGVLSIYKKLNLYRENQKLRVWKNEGKVRSLKGSSVLIVGLGDIGREFGWRMKALGCTVTVSYTHLDVYKRQGIHGHGRYRRRSDRRSFVENGFL